MFHLIVILILIGLQGSLVFGSEPQGQGKIFFDGQEVTYEELQELQEKQRKDFFKNREQKQKLNAIKPYFFTGITLLGIVAITYAGLKWWQKREINKVLAQYNQSIDTISPIQFLFLVVAYKKDIHRLKELMLKYGQNRLEEPWLMPAIAQFYYGKVVSPQQVVDLKNFFIFVLSY